MLLMQLMPAFCLTVLVYFYEKIFKTHHSLAVNHESQISIVRQVACYSESEIAQSCPTTCDPIDYSLLVSSVFGIFQAKILE